MFYVLFPECVCVCVCVCVCGVKLRCRHVEYTLHCVKAWRCVMGK